MSSEMINIRQVRVADKFWDKLIDNATEHVIPYQWRVLNDNEPDATCQHHLWRKYRCVGTVQGL